MEIYRSTPKNWAKRKRSQRFSDPKEKRKAHPNGQPLRTIYSEGYFTTNSELFSFEKEVRSPGIDTAPNHTVFGHTPFEQELGLPMVNGECYSLNRRKNWAKIAKILEGVDCDEMCTVSRGKGTSKKWGEREVNVTKIGYFDVDEMRLQNERLEREQRRYDRALSGEALYIRDRFYHSIQRRERRNELRRWKEMQSVAPKGISKRSSFLPIKAITARTVRAGCKMRMATVRSFGSKSFWCPTRQNDDGDFIEIDLGGDHFVEAVSTRGRVLRRNSDHEVDRSASHCEFVRKYRVKIRGDAVGRNGEGDDGWLDVGVFAGNTDSETEVANTLGFANQTKRGVICRRIRLFPLSIAEGGYHGAKAMRVGVYGHSLRTAEPRTRTESGPANGMEVDRGCGQLIGDKSVAAAIITVRQPSATMKRNCWAVNGRAEGVYGSKHGHRGHCSYGLGKLRRDSMTAFKHRVKGLRRVKDYGLDAECIAIGSVAM